MSMNIELWCVVEPNQIKMSVCIIPKSVQHSSVNELWLDYQHAL